MPSRPVGFRPGPKRIAAAVQLAGFPQSARYPDVTDACGALWVKPSAVLIAVAIAGAESSAQAWAYQVNFPGTTNESVDYGLFQINGKYNAQFFGAVKTPEQLNWAILSDNCVMGCQIWNGARAARIAAKRPPARDWQPWYGYTGGGYKRERYNGKSWLHWADSGVRAMNAELAAGKSLAQIASVDLDPLVY